METIEPIVTPARASSAVQERDPPPTRSTTVFWGLLANGDAGTQIELTRRADVSIQIDGTFGVNGCLQLEGSNDDGAHWHVLLDRRGAPARWAMPGVYGVDLLTTLVRPRVAAGDATTQLSCSVFLLGDA